LKIHESAENYLESILMIQREKGSVRSIDVVNDLGFSKPSVSVAMKNLEAAGYIERDSAGHISLLPPGLEIAQSNYARHTTLVKLLTHIGVSEATAREDACVIEHHLSDETFEALKKFCKDII
jgi:Mn-dependent DtxR family transcriptional regulator